MPSADEKVSSTLKQQIVQARTAKKMTQAQLAQVTGQSGTVLAQVRAVSRSFFCCPVDDLSHCVRCLNAWLTVT